MTTESLFALRYPIGEFDAPATISDALLQSWVQDIAEFPHRLRSAVSELTEVETAWPYRPEGWTIRQLVHHCADSHSNASIRFRLALTEDNPTIRPYTEGLWAQLPDAGTADLEPSLRMVEGLHQRWVHLMRTMTTEQWARTFYHPEHQKSFSLRETAGSYAWHCNHHLAHVRQAAESNGKFG